MKKILFFIPILTLMFNSVFAMPTKTNDVIIADYPFTNRVNELSVSEKQEITKNPYRLRWCLRFNIEEIMTMTNFSNMYFTLTKIFKSSLTFQLIRETAVIWVITMLNL